mmetsp:Transcript_45047/g.119478  ORF Transcript_45047/g.119478 Transcript_45047/m.119478 type:complete len:81 (-) Transcript_45047:179-421(-)
MSHLSGCLPKGTKGVDTILRTPPPCKVCKMSLEVDTGVSAVPCVIRDNTQCLSTTFYQTALIQVPVFLAVFSNRRSSSPS